MPETDGDWKVNKQGTVGHNPGSQDQKKRPLQRIALDFVEQLHFCFT